ncbi:hypothetical protein [Aliikangiella sp. IMCC44632]
MKIIKMLLGLSCLTLSFNVASKEIESLPKFEAEITSCLQAFSASNQCLAELVKHHLPAGNEAIKPVADQVEQIFVQWLSKEKVANVYPIERKELGDFMVLRNYIVEDTTASVLLFEITYRKALGSWYVLKFNINSKPEYISRKLGY